MKGLRCGDQDIGRAPELLLTLLGCGVTRANGSGERPKVVSKPSRGFKDSFQWSSEVAVDVVVEGLQRRKVKDFHSRALFLAP